MGCSGLLLVSRCLGFFIVFRLLGVLICYCMERCVDKGNVDVLGNSAYYNTRTG